MYDDSHLPGSDCYVGHCPKCGRINYEVYDEICGHCELDAIADEEEITDEEAYRFTAKFQEEIDMRKFANDLLGSISKFKR